MASLALYHPRCVAYHLRLEEFKFAAAGVYGRAIFVRLCRGSVAPTCIYMPDVKIDVFDVSAEGYTVGDALHDKMDEGLSMHVSLLCLAMYFPPVSSAYATKVSICIMKKMKIMKNSA